MWQMIRLTAIAVGVLVSSVSAQAQVYQTTGTITNVRHYTVRQPNVAAGYSLLQLSAPMQGGCSWGFIDATDKNALAFILATKASGAAVKLTYDSAVAPPWGDPIVCGVMVIDVP